MRHVCFLVSLIWFVACGSDPSAQGTDAGDTCDPSADFDGDCLTDATEGCSDDGHSVDTDGDGTPDYRDRDADDDGIEDQIEAGSCGSPRDTDGDGVPDYRDTDSDNDGVDDVYEDRDGNGLLGKCEKACSDNAGCDAEANETCSLPMDGEGQGVCVSTLCADGETNPRNPDTDGDGTQDNEEGTFICQPQSSNNPWGLKRIRYVDSVDTAFSKADWRIALEVGAEDKAVSITGATNKESAYLFDMSAPSVQVAGFLVTRRSIDITAVKERNLAIDEIVGTLPILSADMQVSGTNQTSLDGFETVLGTRVLVRASPISDVTSLRAAIIPALLNRSPSEVEIPEVSWKGSTSDTFVVVYQTVYRGDAETMYMGAVVRQEDYGDRSKPSALFADDMSNGTGLSVSGNGEDLECEQYIANKQAKADIIWIVDESGSTDTYRSEIIANAESFFQKALDVGLDFRMGVTDMTGGGPGGEPGIFATRDATTSTGDRWLLPTESTLFSEAINDPSGPDEADLGAEHGLTQGRDAMLRHLPRDDADPAKVRSDAQLVTIYVTDERPDEVEDANIVSDGYVSDLSAAQVQAILELIGEYLEDFVTHMATAHLIGIPVGGTTMCEDLSEPSDGYSQLVDALGGQQGPICQDLDVTIDAMIESIIGDASPITLSTIPISSSIAVSRNGVRVERSRTMGWDYRSSSNSIIFYNMPFDPENPPEIVVSYRRWAEQVGIE